VKIGELFVELGFKTDQPKLKDFVKSIGDARLSSIMAAAGLGTLYKVISDMRESAEAAALPLNAFAKVTGQSTLELQKWSYAAERAGVKGDLIAQSISDLQMSVARMRLTGEGMSGYTLLGINPVEVLRTKNYFELLGMILGRLKGLSPEFQRLALQQIGQSDQLLVLGDRWKEINDQVTLNGAEIQKIVEAHAEIWRLLKDIGTLWNKLYANSIGPILGGAAKSIADAIETIKPSGSIGDTLKWELRRIPFLGDEIAAINPGFFTPSRSTTNNNKIDIHVNGAQDPQAIGEEVERHVSRIISDAEDQSFPEAR
jgi:hypothetical protein